MTPPLINEEVLVSRLGHFMLLTLHRPRALNSITTNMVRTLERALEEAAADPQCYGLVLEGSGGKAFCAGGDVRTIAEAGLRHQDLSIGLTYFREEYVLNFLIHHFPKPYISLLDGIVMGGGAGLSVHGSFRVATERTVFAMPECLIGLTPDVGASYFLSRMPFKLGMYLALTGARLNGEESKAFGIATHLVPHERIDELKRSLAGLSLQGAPAGPLRAANAELYAEVEALLRALEFDFAAHLHPEAVAESDLQDGVSDSEGQASMHLRGPSEGGAPGPAASSTLASALGRSALLPALREIEAAMHAPDLLTALARMEAAASSGAAWALTGVHNVRRSSPLSLHVTWRSMTFGAQMDIGECLRVEFRVVARCILGRSDFFEGVRALLIDKDNKPRFLHPSPEAVPTSDVDALFRPFISEGSDELVMPTTLPWDQGKVASADPSLNNGRRYHKGSALELEDFSRDRSRGPGSGPKQKSKL